MFFMRNASQGWTSNPAGAPDSMAPRGGHHSREAGCPTPGCTHTAGGLCQSVCLTQWEKNASGVQEYSFLIQMKH